MSAAESDVLTIHDANGVLLGLLILAQPSDAEFPPTLHLGYLLSEAEWGKGYATELIDGLAVWFRREGDAVQLLAGVGRDNLGSARILIKNGFTLDADLSSADTDIYGLYIPCDYDRLYGKIKGALGVPGQLVKDIFAQDIGRRLRILDIGCGQGRDGLLMARLGHSVVGVDLSPNGIGDMLATADQESLPIEGIVADVKAFEPTGDFDVILIDRTLHMLPETTYAPILNRLTDHIKPNGRFVIVDEATNIPAFKAIFSASEYSWESDHKAAEQLVLRRS